jgi:hypothetical protein
MIRRLLLLGGIAAPLAPLAHADDILLYEENSSQHHGRAALVKLGYAYTAANSSNLTSMLASGVYEVAVIDMPSTLPTGAWQSGIASFITGGGKVVMGFWRFESEATLQSAFKCTSATSLGSPGPLYKWDTTHPIFTTPYSVPTITVRSDLWADDGDELRASGGGTLLGGYQSASSASRGSITEANSGRTLYDGFLWDDYSGDEDGDGTADIIELVADEIYYVMYGGCDVDSDGYDATGGTCGGTDCDDTDALVHPGATEIPYDGVDDDCDGTDLVDYDGDGYDASVVGGADCDDTDAAVHPGATETADGIDDDCDGTVDETTVAGDDDGDGYTEEGGDCDDGRATVHPGSAETCDGVDEDCDGTIDEDTSCADDDGDGYTEDAGDCHDGDASVHTGATEVLGNGVDDDCDGVVDDGGGDTDGDGFSPGGGDCDDADATAHPGSGETADGIDNDCDGVVDEGTTAYDDDGDGYSEDAGDCDDADATVSPGAADVADGRDTNCDGRVDEGTDAYDDDLDGVSESGGDCDDADGDVHPGASETADGVDEDCDGLVDEGTEAADGDGDGVSALDGDCDDTDGWSYPGAREVCDGVDNDCDDTVDNDCVTDGEAPPDSGPNAKEGGCGCGGHTPVDLGLVVAGLALATRRRRR